MQDCKDGSGLQFIKFDFLTGGQAPVGTLSEHCRDTVGTLSEHCRNTAGTRPFSVLELGPIHDKFFVFSQEKASRKSAEHHCDGQLSCPAHRSLQPLGAFFSE